MQWGIRIGLGQLIQSDSLNKIMICDFLDNKRFIYFESVPYRIHHDVLSRVWGSFKCDGNSLVSFT